MVMLCTERRQAQHQQRSPGPAAQWNCLWQATDHARVCEGHDQGRAHLEPQVLQGVIDGALLLGAHHLRQPAEGLEPSGQLLQVLIACNLRVSAQLQDGTWLAQPA